LWENAPGSTDSKGVRGICCGSRIWIDGHDVSFIGPLTVTKAYYHVEVNKGQGKVEGMEKVENGVSVS
jgi:hypothetical protein